MFAGLLAVLSLALRNGVLWMVLGFILACAQPSRWAAYWQLLLAVGLAALFSVSLLKLEVHRDTATSFAGAYAMSRMIPGAAPLFWTIASLAAFSQVYLGVHYPLDVVGGAIVGLAAAAFTIGGTRWSRSISARSRRRISR